MGSKKNPIYRVVAADSRSPRDGKFLEIVGRYNPQTDPSTIDLDAAKVKDWLGKGAQPTEAVAKLIKISGHREVAAMAELLAYLARELVDDPDAVRVESEERDGALVLVLHVAADDVGKVIGRQGRIARALRTLVRASAAREGRRVLVEIADPEADEGRRAVRRPRDAVGARGGAGGGRARTRSSSAATTSTGRTRGDGRAAAVARTPSRCAATARTWPRSGSARSSSRQI